MEPHDPGARAARRRGALWAAATAAALALVSHAWIGQRHLNPSDEGFLWSGVQQTLAGRVPLRDFQSYEPLRYYWCALVGLWLGDGIRAVRAAGALFQALGLFLGLLVARRSAPPWMLPPIGLLLLLWMFPAYKVYESSAAMAALYVAVRLLERPGAGTALAAGVFAGSAGFLGRSHGLYAFASLALLILYVAWKRRASPLRELAGFFAGVALGLAPLLFMIALVPGFGPALLASVAFFAERGANLPLPWPWPWRLPFESLPAHERVALSASFLLPLAVYAAGVLLALRAPAADLARRAVPIAASFVGACYLHHVAIRSDPAHLAQSIHPALLGLLALPAALGARREAAAALASLAAAAVVTGLAVPAANPALAALRLGSPAREWVAFDAAGDPLQLDAESARYYRGMQRVLTEVVPADQPLLVAPGYTTLYPLLGRAPPLWQLYFLWPCDPAGDRALVSGLADRGVDWVLVIDDVPRAELSLRALCPGLWEHLQSDFARAARGRLPPAHHLFRRRTAAEPSE